MTLVKVSATKYYYMNLHVKITLRDLGKRRTTTLSDILPGRFHNTALLNNGDSGGLISNANDFITYS